MAFKEIKVQEEVTANLVPMIDIMFLLLLFFMLNADMSQRGLEEVVTPIANQAQEDKSDDNPDRVTVNVFHVSPDTAKCEQHEAGNNCLNWSHWKLSVLGQHFQPLDPPDKPLGLPRPREADLKRFQEQMRSLGEARRENPNDPKKLFTSRSMIIRADKGAPYGCIQRALTYASKAGFYRVETAVQIEKSAIKR